MTAKGFKDSRFFLGHEAKRKLETESPRLAVNLGTCRAGRESAPDLQLRTVRGCPVARATPLELAWGIFWLVPKRHQWVRPGEPNQTIW